MHSHAFVFTLTLSICFVATYAQGDSEVLGGCPSKVNRPPDTIEGLVTTSREDLSALIFNFSNKGKNHMIFHFPEFETTFRNPPTALFHIPGRNASGFPLWDSNNTVSILEGLPEAIKAHKFYLQLPVSVCQSQCGTGFIHYSCYDFWSRFMTWKVPLFLLLGNFHFAPLGWWNLCFMLLHLLGDPIDFMASLNMRLEVGSRLYRWWKEKEDLEKRDSQISRSRGSGTFDQKKNEMPTEIPGSVGGDYVVEIGPLEQDDSDGRTLYPVSNARDPDIPETPQRSTSPPVSHQVQLPKRTNEEASQECLQLHSDHDACESPCRTNCSTTSLATQQMPTPSDHIEEERFSLHIPALDLATICIAYDDLGHLFPHEEMFKRLQTFSGSATIPQRLLVVAAFLEAATEISEAWVDEFFRTTVAVFGYVIVLALAFVNTIAPWEPDKNPPAKIGNRTLTPGTVPNQEFLWVPSNFTFSENNPRINTRTSHAIAFAISYCWVIAAVILSAAGGGFVNHRTVEKALRRLKRKVQPAEFNMPEWKFVAERPIAVAGATGMNYSYRPVKSFPGDNRYRSYGRTLVVLIPLVSSASCAFLISWFTPTVGFGCRSLHQLCLFILWILSHTATLFIRRGLIVGTQEPASQYVVILIKDSIVTVTHVTFLSLAFLGWYNRCLCWSAWLSRRDEAYVWLYTEGQFLRNLRTVWPGLTFAAVACQLLFAAAMIYGKPRCRIFKRTEEEQEYNIRRLRWYEQQLSAHCKKNG